MEYEYQYTTPEERAARRAQREKARKARLRARRLRLMKRGLPALVLLALVLAAAVRGHSGEKPEKPEDPAPEKSVPAAAEPAAAPPAPAPYAPRTTAATAALTEEIISQYAVVVDLSTDTVLGAKNADAVISPASMTKILTVLVAAEHVTDLDDTFTITIDITDYSYSNGCTAAGFALGEAASVRDLFYGTVLPSGADAALGLAMYVSGSQEAFVALMNQKAEELGLSDTAHFTNCVGLYDPEHHCTVTDMALILKAAEENELCRQVLSAHTYTTASTPEHPGGLLLSNWFLRRIEDKDTGGLEVLCAKTGYVIQSGSCAASYAVAQDGRALLCVTADSTSSWRCIYDHVALYQKFGAGQEN